MNTAVNFQALTEKMDDLIEEYGHYKTANMITDAYELDMITEAQGRTLRFQLGIKFGVFMYHDEDANERLLGLDRIDLTSEPVVETNQDAMLNRRRTDCVFDKAVNGTPDAMFYGI
tara:strand:+ start:4310 stop:4657 length:348 start_codon:yes stop_codon:yes gene_type:complete